IEDSSPLPDSAALYQNYPNPFNPVTEITFSIPETSVVDLSVYNTAGKLVRTLVNEKRTYGHHAISFDASDLNSGIYFYRLQTDGRTIDAKRMLLIK
ncbi:MAG: T9SS type A sorting domain-containing protein, partial [Candidatus Delongbacteria bacterium]